MTGCLISHAHLPASLPCKTFAFRESAYRDMDNPFNTTPDPEPAYVVSVDLTGNAIRVALVSCDLINVSILTPAQVAGIEIRALEWWVREEMYLFATGRRQEPTAAFAQWTKIWQERQPLPA